MNEYSYFKDEDGMLYRKSFLKFEHLCFDGKWKKCSSHTMKIVSLTEVTNEEMQALMLKILKD